MPTMNPHLQRTFKLTLHDGEPEGLVEATPAGRIIMCCPLCGCSHQIMNVDMAKPYTPLCQEIPVMFKTQRVEWLKRFPEVTAFKALRLIGAIG